MFLNKSNLCGTCLEELKKSLKNTRLGVEILNGGPSKLNMVTIGGPLNIAYN
jgi:hypothetical protein